MAIKSNSAARALIIYSLLIGGSVIFSLPFIWMIGTSFKVDRELSKQGIRFVPDTPIPAQQSPYFDDRFYEVEASASFDELAPAIRERLAASDRNWSDLSQSRDEIIYVLVPGLYARLEQLLPDPLWSEGGSARTEAALARIDETLIDQVERNTLRRMSFGSLRVRSVNLQEKDLTKGGSVAAFYPVMAGDATLIDRDAAQADLHYDFSEIGEQDVVIEQTLDLPFKADELLRIQLSLTPDDSWHEIDFVLEMNGKKYQGMRTQHTGMTQPTVVTLQEFGPDDAPDSNKIKLWIPYKEVGASADFESDPNRVKLTMTLRESSPFKAWKIKCLRNYYKTINYVPFWRYTATSALLVVLNIIGNILSCSLAAYAFSRLNWPGRNFSFGLMLATMMIPPQITMIPYFLIIKSLGWYNTLTPLWIMSFFGNAFNIFLLRQFMKGIPRDLEDAAKIDGCNFLQIYWHVMMPLIKPTLICIAVFTFMGVWNDFMGPLIFLADQRLYPLSLGLYALKVQQGEFGMMMAGSLLMTLPVIALFFLAQRYFIQGIALTGTKG